MSFFRSSIVLTSCLLWLGLASLPAWSREKIKVMYLETEVEVRAAVLIQRMDLPLETYRIGMFKVGNSLYGVVRFGASVRPGEPADHHRLGAMTAMLCDRIFGEFPELTRIDFEGVSERETKEHKPEVYFSASIDRTVWKQVDKSTGPLQRVKAAGPLYFDPKLAVGQPYQKPKPKPKVKAKPGSKPKTNKAKPAAKNVPKKASQPATRDHGKKRESKSS